jgi:hypothetical protein
VALAILVELNIRLTVLVVETARLERRGVNDNVHKKFYSTGPGANDTKLFEAISYEFFNKLECLSLASLSGYYSVYG